jgi:hypothetical protein
MKKIILLSMAVFLCFYGIVFAEETGNPSIRQLGISFSIATGAGLYYQFILSPDYRLKLDGLFLYNEGEDNEMDASANGGFEFQKTIHSTNYTRLYGLAGGAYWFEKSRSPLYDDPADSDRVTGIDKYFHRWLTVGVGLGIEFLILSHVAINVDLLYYYEHHFGENYRAFGFGGGTGIGYAF